MTGKNNKKRKRINGEERENKTKELTEDYSDHPSFFDFQHARVMLLPSPFLRVQMLLKPLVPVKVHIPGVGPEPGQPFRVGGSGRGKVLFELGSGAGEILADFAAVHTIQAVCE